MHEIPSLLGPLTLLGVAKKHWAFRSEIILEKTQLKGMEFAELEFEGLDTFATVYLVLHIASLVVLHTDSHRTVNKSWRRTTTLRPTR